jgi:phenylpropionate dioxygenase-like ring-hydroxylating dioxygenase large terminal subunit
MTASLPFDPADLEACLIPPGRTLPAQAYTSEAVFDWETQHVLQASWVCLGRADELARPGDQRALRVGSEAVLLVRGADGALDGFFNTCRHRGHELLPCGGPVVNRRAIRCPYHSWTYGLDGAFKTAPGFVDRPGWSKTDPDNGLRRARVEEWGGWAFVNCSGDAPPLADHLGNAMEALGPYELERLEIVATHEYEIEANWKLIAENYHECYHCTNIHPELCRVTPPESGQAFEPTGLVIGGSMELMDHAETMSLTGESGGVPMRRLDRAARRTVLYLQVFPNLLLSPHPDYVLTHLLEPLSPGRTRIECQWLFPPRATSRPEFDPSYAVEFWDITNRQDWAACEGVQRGVAGRGYRQGPLSDAEGNVWQLVAVMARAYLSGRAAGPVPGLGAEARGSATVS